MLKQQVGLIISCSWYVTKLLGLFYPRDFDPLKTQEANEVINAKNISSCSWRNTVQNTPFPSFSRTVGNRVPSNDKFGLILISIMHRPGCHGLSNEWRWIAGFLTRVAIRDRPVQGPDCDWRTWFQNGLILNYYFISVMFREVNRVDDFDNTHLQEVHRILMNEYGIFFDHWRKY